MKALFTAVLMLAAMSAAHADPDWKWRYEKQRICFGWERLGYEAQLKRLIAQAADDFQRAADCIAEITADMNRGACPNNPAYAKPNCPK